LNRRETRENIDLSPHQSKTFTFTLPESYHYEGRFSVDSYDSHLHARSADEGLVSSSDVDTTLSDQNGKPIFDILDETTNEAFNVPGRR
jgi:hypothetical protein